MIARWEDINARARGLGPHLLPRATLEALARAPDLAALAAALADAGIAPAVEGPPTAVDLELGARRETARRLRTLARWLGPRVDALAVVFEDEDRRSVRALLRGAAAGAPAEARLAGLIPTPSLPERALEDLAQRARPAEIATLLALWGHPFGRPLLEATDQEHPDLVRMELALAHTWAERATRGAGAGGAALRTYTEESIDLLNAQSAILLAGGHHEIPLNEAFVAGGRALTREEFLRALTAGGAPATADALAPRFAGIGLVEALREAGHHPETLERNGLVRRLRAWKARARSAPLSAAPVLHYLLRLRIQLLQLRDLIWGVALSVPVETRLSRLVEE